jgi:hypothetical protein
LRGLEASVQWQLGSWSIWSAYTWSKALDRIDGVVRPRDWDQRHALSGALTWQRRSWSLAVQGAYRSGRPTTPIVRDLLVAPLLGERNTARMTRHLTIDARVARRFPIGDGVLVAFAQLTNALNRSNRCCTELDLPDESSNPLALELQDLPTYPRVPAVGISFEF